MIPSVVVISCDNLLADFRNIIQPMTYHDYDLIEVIGIVISSLTVRAWYPTSLQTDILDSLGNHFTIGYYKEHLGADMIISTDMYYYEQGLTFLYHHLYTYLSGMGLYTPDGRMEHIYYDVSGKDLLLSRVPNLFESYMPLRPEAHNVAAPTHP